MPCLIIKSKCDKNFMFIYFNNKLVIGPCCLHRSYCRERERKGNRKRREELRIRKQNKAGEDTCVEKAGVLEEL